MLGDITDDEQFVLDLIKSQKILFSHSRAFSWKIGPLPPGVPRYADPHQQRPGASWVTSWLTTSEALASASATYRQK